MRGAFESRFIETSLRIGEKNDDTMVISLSF